MDDTSDIKQSVQLFFNHEHDGGNHLRDTFLMMVKYFSQTKEITNSAIVMFNEFESLFIYMLQLAEQNKVDVDRGINWTDYTGATLIHFATALSEKIALALIKLDVKVNRIDNAFVTPHFRVRNLLATGFQFHKLILVSIFTAIDD